MATHTSTTPASVTPFVSGHKRSKTAILKAIVSPHKSHKKSASDANTNHETGSNPLNTYMLNTSLPPQLPPIDTTRTFIPPLGLDPPLAPFVVEERKKRMHKKSISSISLSSFKLKREESPTTPGSVSRGSFDISCTLRDLVSPNRGSNSELDGSTSPDKSNHSKQPSKSRSAIDIAILRRKNDKKEVARQPKENKENQRPREMPITSIPYVNFSARESVTLPSDSGPSEELVSPPVNHSSSYVRPRITPNGSETSVDLINQPRKSTSSEERKKSYRLREVEELMRRYTPTEYTASSQRNFFGPNEPALIKPPERGSRNSKSKEGKPRPKSEYIPHSAMQYTGSSISSPRKSYEIRRSEEKSDTSKNGKTSPTGSQSSSKSRESIGLNLAGIDTAFEALLDSRGVPPNMREKMRGLDVRVKQEFIHKERQMEKPAKGTSSAMSITSGLGIFGKRPKTSESRPKSKGKDQTVLDPHGSPTKRSRPRSRTFGSSKDKEAATAPSSPIKRPKNVEERQFKGKILFPTHTASSISNTGQPSPTMLGTLEPEEWLKWLKDAGRRRNFGHGIFAEDVENKMPEYEKHMKDVEVAVLHKLRLVVRNEKLRWVESFTKHDGIEAIWAMIERVLGVEWREEHEDNILHELLLCLKGLCTASLALQKLAEMGSVIFPRLLDSLFDEEKKGPSEFTTRGIIISLLYVHLQTSPASQRPLRTRRILAYLADKKPDAKKRPLDFIEVAHVNRPYRRWCKEVVNVTKEVFWIFLHGSNIIPVPPPISSSLSYAERNFPQERPPVPAAAHVGGVEWEATSYLAVHLDLLNGCIASLATREERNDLRTDLKNSGWERALGGALRTCKEKLHTAVHEGLKTWARAATEDEWYVGDVRFGPRTESSRPASPIKLKKREDESPPKLELGLGLDFGDKRSPGLAAGWDY